MVRWWFNAVRRRRLIYALSARAWKRESPVTSRCRNRKSIQWLVLCITQTLPMQTSWAAISVWGQYTKLSRNDGWQKLYFRMRKSIGKLWGHKGFGTPLLSDEIPGQLLGAKLHGFQPNKCVDLIESGLRNQQNCAYIHKLVKKIMKILENLNIIRFVKSSSSSSSFKFRSTSRTCFTFSCYK